jgi:hypothetical protein
MPPSFSLMEVEKFFIQFFLKIPARPTEKVGFSHWGDFHRGNHFKAFYGRKPF